MALKELNRELNLKNVFEFSLKILICFLYQNKPCLKICSCLSACYVSVLKKLVEIIIE